MFLGSSLAGRFHGMGCVLDAFFSHLGHLRCILFRVALGSAGDLACSACRGPSSLCSTVIEFGIVIGVGARSLRVRIAAGFIVAAAVTSVAVAVVIVAVIAAGS